METNKKCCAFFDARHKKFFAISFGFILFAIIALGVASLNWKMHQYRNGYGMMGGDYSRCGKMMGYDSRYCPGPVGPNPSDQFILPQDALMNGEIAIVVDNIESAKKAVSDVSFKNGGNVYATFISYASKNLRNGSMVVQIPAGNFDNTFDDLKKVGTKIIQESSQQIPPNNYYYPMAATATDSATSVSAQENADASDEVQATETKPEIVTYPAPSQLVQDKAYIKVIFADYGAIGKKAERKNFLGSVINIGNPSDQNMRNNIFVVIGVKIIFLIAVFGLLFIVFKKIFQAIRGRKNKVTKVHVVRQMTKTHKRVVKIATKKKKKA